MLLKTIQNQKISGHRREWGCSNLVITHNIKVYLFEKQIISKWARHHE